MMAARRVRRPVREHAAFSIYWEKTAMNAQRRVGVGIIGTGNISSAYLKAMQGFDVLDVRGLADLKPELAAQPAEVQP